MGPSQKGGRFPPTVLGEWGCCCDTRRQVPPSPPLVLNEGGVLQSTLPPSLDYPQADISGCHPPCC